MALKTDPRALVQPTLSDALKMALEADLAAHLESQASFFAWSMKVPEVKGPLDFARWPFQLELYKEGFTDQELIVMKGTQLGISAWLVRFALCHADTRGARVLYLFPRDRQLHDLSDARIRPLILSEYLRTRVPPASVQNKMLKTVGAGLCYFRGSESVQGLESIDADVLCLDEHDLLVQQHIPIAERRLGASDLGLIRRIGFPTITNWGIHAAFVKTDQRRWYVKCEFCNLRQPITWGGNVDVERGIRVCSSCRKGPLDLSEGEWVATYPDRDQRGYHIHKLMVPRESIMPRLIEASQEHAEYKKQVFWNRDLGEPWESAGARLSPALIAACQRQDLVMQGGYDGANPVFAGLDVASTRALTMWIGERLDDDRGRLLFAGDLDSFEEAARAMDRFRVSMCCVDHLPEGRLARAYAERFAGRVYIASYGTETQKDVMTIDAEQRRVSVKRVEAIDAAVERVRGMRELLPMDLPNGFVGAMCSNVRSVERDDLGRTKVLWRATGPDDVLQALVYSIVAAECFYIQQQVAHSSEITSIDEMEALGFQRSTLGDPDVEAYSEGPREGEYSMEEEIDRLIGGFE